VTSYSAAAAGGLAVFAATGMLAARGGRGAAALARLARGAYVAATLGYPWGVASAAVGAALHASLAALAAVHVALLCALLGGSWGLVAALLPLARACAWGLAASSLAALSLRAASYALGLPVGRCAPVLDALLAAASAAALLWPWSWPHWVLGAAAGGLAGYMLLGGHVARASRLLASRMLRV